MIHNATLLRISAEPADGFDARAAFDAAPGWVPPRGEAGTTRLEIVDGQWIAQYAQTLVWIDIPNKLVLIDTADSVCADRVACALVACQTGLVLAPIQLAQTPARVMVRWAAEPCEIEFFTVGRVNTLRPDSQGRLLPSSLNLVWDDRVTFTLLDNFTLTDIVILEDTRGPPAEADDAWNADAALFTGEMHLLIPDLIRVLGGEVLAGVTDVQAKGEIDESL